MPIDKFKFVSPGVQVAEIDNSQRPAEPAGVGPVIIGRAQRGPGLRPVQIDSFSEFVEIFGTPFAGGDGNDVWRNGNRMAPSYGAYAAQAYLKNSSPIIYVRLLGNANADAMDPDGLAGWHVGGDSTTTAEGGNYGLFLIHSSSGTPNDQTGTLAAVFYVKSGSVALAGLDVTGTLQAAATCDLIQTVGSDYELKAFVRTPAGNTETINFNFDKNSKKYIRKVFNTNPTLMTPRISATTGSYFLGETYDYAVATLGTAPAEGAAFGCIMALDSSSCQQNDQRRSATSAQTGWIVGQDLGDSGSFDFANLSNLFRLKSINAGGWESQNLKVSISDVQGSTSEYQPYGSFTVEIRKADDTDAAPQYVERFGTCNLNPNSKNYVARKVGNKFVTWNAQERRYEDFGEFDNMSKFIYVEMNSDVAAGLTNERLVPFGFRGIPKWNDWSFGTNSDFPTNPASFPAAVDYSSATFAGDGIVDDRSAGSFVGTGLVAGFTGTMGYPSFWYRDDTLEGNLGSPRDAYFGISTNVLGGTRFDESYKDIVRPYPVGAPGGAYGDASADAMTSSTDFTLDDVRWASSSFSGISDTQASWAAGNRLSGDSITAASGIWTDVLVAGFNKFTMPLQGGFDGENIREADPFGPGSIEFDEDGGSKTVSEVANAPFNSVKQAVDTCADPEVVQCNMMVVPGNYVPGITSHLIATCEKRADSLAVIDLEGGYTPPADLKADFATPSNVDNTISLLENRGINSSYGCAYYPWVQSRDTESSILFYAPPSIAAVGTYSSAQRTSELWFAPAGFTRGGLTEGSAGIPVIGVIQRLTSKDRDKLYEANINPIATFPAEGIVVFGQKTLQITPSALDRVNVRRLLIYVKRQVSYMASRLLFDQNVQVTWDRFTNQVIPFLSSVKQRLGLEDFKVILDKTTTTPDLIDRNIMYAKIFLKPARAIEFIAIDFVITNAGASFED